MICKVCGRNIEREEANFCEYCGTSLRNIEEIETVIPEMPEKEKVENETAEKEIPFSNWLGSMLLPLIPFVGSVIYIVMMFIWAFGGSAPKSKRNWARANLIVTAIGIVMVIYLFISMAGSGSMGFIK